MDHKLARMSSPDESHSVDPLVREALKELENSRKIARDIIANARREASDIVARSRVEAQKVLDEARREALGKVRVQEEEQANRNKEIFEKAFAEGVSQGEAEGQRNFEGLLGRLTAVVDYLGKQKREVLKESREEIVDLVLRISERVLKLEQESRKQLLGANLKLVLDDMAEEEEALVLLNPRDMGPVKEHLSQLPPSTCRPLLKEDDSVPEGECRIRGRELNLDLSFKKRFDAIRNRLLERARQDGRGD